MIAVLFPIANTHALVFPVETALHIEDLTGKFGSDNIVFYIT